MHFGGYLADRDEWQAFARSKGLLLIEDAAHAPGVKGVGTFGDAAAFSFYGNKNMTTAEGGAIITRHRILNDMIKRARSHGMTTNTRQRLVSRSPEYDVTLLGFNYRMDELRAAVGLVQLRKLAGWNDARRHLSLHYRRRLAERCPSVLVPFNASWVSAHHLMPGSSPRGKRAAAPDRAAQQARRSDDHSLSAGASVDVLPGPVSGHQPPQH
ncbi:dTDP-4-amino-4,6-dideoxygalactose transaminase [Bradyrhizobium sp. i1.4.4]